MVSLAEHQVPERAELQACGKAALMELDRSWRSFSSSPRPPYTTHGLRPSEGPGLSFPVAEKAQNPAFPCPPGISGRVPWLTYQLCCVGLWSKHLEAWPSTALKQLVALTGRRASRWALRIQAVGGTAPALEILQPPRKMR